MSKEISDKKNKCPEMEALIKIKNKIDKELNEFQKQNERAIKEYEEFKEKYGIK